MRRLYLQSSGTCPSSFTPEVRYKYQFEGRELTGDKIGFVAMGADHPGVAEKTLERYPAGAEVAVFVDPQRPTRSVLTRGVHLLLNAPFRE
jgi:hypothetical protein